MRRTGLLIALLLGLVAVVLPSTAGAAATDQVAVSWSANPAAAGQSVTVTVTVTRDGAPLAGAEVFASALDFTTGESRDLIGGPDDARVKVDAAGSVSATFTADGPIEAQVYAFDAEGYAVGESPVVSVLKVAPRVTMSAPASVAGPYLAAAASVDVVPAETGQVVLQTAPSADGPWAASTVDSAFFAERAGTLWVRAVVEATDVSAEGASNPVQVTVGSRAVPRWLRELNRFRKEYGAPPAAENAARNAWVRKHVVYMSRNRTLTHVEVKGRPGWSKEGAEAGAGSVLSVGDSASTATAGWMNAPFHAVSMLDPEATLASFGFYRGYAALWPQSQDVTRGDFDVPARPYHWPADGGRGTVRVFQGESPDPLSSCGRTYRRQFVRRGTGAPVYISYGNGAKPVTKATATLVSKGRRLPVCVLTEKNYKGEQRGLARSILAGRHHTVVLMPLNRLSKGKHTATVTANGRTDRWTFTIR